MHLDPELRALIETSWEEVDDPEGEPITPDQLDLFAAIPPDDCIPF